MSGLGLIWNPGPGVTFDAAAAGVYGAGDVEEKGAGAGVAETGKGETPGMAGEVVENPVVGADVVILGVLKGGIKKSKSPSPTSSSSKSVTSARPPLTPSISTSPNNESSVKEEGSEDALLL